MPATHVPRTLAGLRRLAPAAAIRAPGGHAPHGTSKRCPTPRRREQQKRRRLLQTQAMPRLTRWLTALLLQIRAQLFGNLRFARFAPLVFPRRTCPTRAEREPQTEHERTNTTRKHTTPQASKNRHITTQSTQAQIPAFQLTTSDASNSCTISCNNTSAHPHVLLFSLAVMDAFELTSLGFSQRCKISCSKPGWPSNCSPLPLALTVAFQITTSIDNNFCTICCGITRAPHHC